MRFKTGWHVCTGKADKVPNDHEVYSCADPQPRTTYITLTEHAVKGKVEIGVKYAGFFFFNF